jgi:hypothetical protein
MELQKMIKAMTEVNLCTYFLLPLLGLSEHSFGESNFINSFLSEDGESIYVRVYNAKYVPEGVRQGSVLVMTTDKEEYLEFYFPDLWVEDVRHFMDGKYSLMSDSAKHFIRLNSGLEYQEERNGLQFSDFRLIALSRSPVLIEEWKRHLYNEGELSILDTDPTTELLEAPEDYMFFKKQVDYTETL